MKEFKKWYQREMDLGFYCTDAEDGWKAAFTNMQQWIMGRRCTGEDVLDYINQELDEK